MNSTPKIAKRAKIIMGTSREKFVVISSDVMWRIIHGGYKNHICRNRPEDGEEAPIAVELVDIVISENQYKSFVYSVKCCGCGQRFEIELTLPENWRDGLYLSTFRDEFIKGRHITQCGQAAIEKVLRNSTNNFTGDPLY